MFPISPLWLCLVASLNVHIFKGGVKPPVTLGSFGEPQSQVVGPKGLQAKVMSLRVPFGAALSDGQAKDHLKG